MLAEAALSLAVGVCSTTWIKEAYSPLQFLGVQPTVTKESMAAGAALLGSKSSQPLLVLILANQGAKSLYQNQE